jgi:hypothetical protein
MATAGKKVRASDVAYVVDYVEATSDVALSTTNGTYTTLVTSNAVSLTAGKLYKITCTPGSYMLTSGSGWATGDTWRFKLERDIGSGFASMARNRALRPNVAIASVTPGMELVGFFSPASSGSVTFRCSAAKTAGAATVASTVSVDTGEGTIELIVECVGERSGSLH